MALTYCPECSNRISRSAPACPSCGYLLKNNVVFIKHEKSALLAAILSLVIPGAGQLYKGRVLSAIFWFFAVGTGYVVLFIPGLILHVLCILFAAFAGTK